MARDPTTIPRFIYGRRVATSAHISFLTGKRVRGHVTYARSSGEVVAKSFDVKHNGHVFAIGSGSSKARFYFSNWSK